MGHQWASVAVARSLREGDNREGLPSSRKGERWTQKAMSQLFGPRAAKVTRAMYGKTERGREKATVPILSCSSVDQRLIMSMPKEMIKHPMKQILPIRH